MADVVRVWAETGAGLGAGLLAGLGVAVPLGAVGVLLLQEALVHGRRAALAGATGVAVVDLVWAGVAVIAGGAVTVALAGREGPVRLVSGLVLAAAAVVALARASRGGPGPVRGGDPAGGPGDGGPRGRVRGAFGRFVALTALNPLTAVWFTALSAGLGDRLASPWAAGSFVLGVFLGSLAWQVVLALAGAGLGARLPPGARRWTAVVGHGVVLLLGLTLVATVAV